LKVAAIMEAHSVTGPAKNLLEFAKRARGPFAGGPLEGLPSVEVCIAAYRRGGEKESPFIQAARAAGLEVEIIPEQGRFDRSIPDQLRRLVARRSPDIIQTHNIKTHFFLRVSGIWKTTPWLAFHHGFTSENLRMRMYNATSRWSMRAAYQAVTVCEPFVRQLEERGLDRKRIRVRPNSVRAYIRPEQAAIEAARAEIPAPPEARLLVTIGRLSQEKGHADLLKTFAQLRQMDPRPSHLVIVGEGVERAALEQQRTRLGLDGVVSFLGLKSDVRPYYALADVFVLPSLSEGSPNVLLEAMAAGLASVSTCVGGVPETVTHEETALLVPARDTTAMAGAIQRLLEDPELRRRLGERAREAAETKFSPEEHCRCMIEMYQQVLAARS
jgi:glycosyltransferase involved in cell wall biosynthesis